MNVRSSRPGTRSSRRAPRRRLDGLRRALRSTRVRAGLALGVGASVAVAGTMAAWTDQAVVSGVSINTGTMNLQVATASGAWQENITGYSDLNVTGLYPGQTSAGVIRVRNSGTGTINYTLGSTAADQGAAPGLSGGLTAKVTTGAVSGTGTARTCGGTVVAGSGGSFNGNLLPSRSLAAGATETFCIQATLNANAASELQGKTTNLTFTFNGTTP